MNIYKKSLPFTCKPTSQLLWLLIWVSLGFGCSKSNTQKSIPDDAHFVVGADFKNLALNMLDLSFLFSGPDDAEGESKANVFENTGIDVLGQAFVFQRNPIDQDGLTYFILPLTDSKMFASFVKNADSTYTLSEKEGLSWLSNKDIVIGINENQAIGVLSSGVSNTESLQKLLLPILNSEEEEDFFTKHPNAKKLFANSFDIACWADFSGGQSYFSSLPFSTKTELVVEVAFEDGKITGTGSLFSDEGDALDDILQGKVSSGFIEKIDGDNPLAVVALNLNMDVFKKAVEKTSYYTSLSDNLSILDINLNDILNMLSGEMALLLPNQTQINTGWPSFSIMASLSDQELQKKLFSKLTTRGLLNQTEPNHYRMILMPDYELIVENGYIGVKANPLNDQKLSESLFSKDMKQVTDGSLLMHMDIARMVSAFPSEYKGVSAALFQQNFKSYSLSMKQNGAGNKKIELLIFTQHPKENGFKTIMRFLDKGGVRRFVDPKRASDTLSAKNTSLKDGFEE